MPIKIKPYQQPLAARPDGILSFNDAMAVQSFGIRSFVVVLPFSKLVSVLEGQFEIPKGKPDLPEDIDDIDLDEVDRPQAVQILLKLLQRGWNKGRKDNVDKIVEYGRRGMASDKSWDVVYIPEITVYAPNPVHFEPYQDGGRIGRLTGDLLNVVIDGMTRGTGLRRLMHMDKKVGDEEVVVRFIPGIERVAARQIFADLNTTPVPVPFADVVQRDARRPAFRIALEVASRVPAVKPKQAYMFVQQALLGPKGESAKEEPAIKDEQETLHRLLRVVDLFEKAMGDRWGDETQVLMSGYGLAAIGRLYFDCEKDEATFQGFMYDRVARMSWDRNDTRVQSAGFAAVGQRKAKTLITSYPTIRKFSELVRSERWRDLEIVDDEEPARASA